MAEPTLFDEASLALIASGGAGKDGKVYSVKPVPVYGPELVTNGDFATDSDWSIYGPNIAISGGKANFTNAVTNTEFLQQAITAPTGVQYRIQFEVSNLAAGDSIKVRFPFQDTTINSNGLHTLYGDGATADFLRITPNSSTGTFSIDNVSVKKVLSGDGDFTFSRGSNLAATRVGADGLIEKGRENLTYNSDWSGVSTDTNPTGWTQFLLGTGTFDATGTSGQIRLQTSDASSRVIIYSNTIGTNGILAVSVYVDAVATTIPLSNLISRSATSTQLLAFEDGVEILYNDNIQAGKRYLVIFNQSAPTEYRFGVGTSSSVLGDVTISRPQIEQGLAATEYIPSPVGATAQAGMLEDEPRFDYSGGATCPSLLLEPSRTNLVKYSEYFDSSDWTKNNVTATNNSAISPDGLQNATLINDGTASNTQHWFYQSVTLSSGTTYTISFYAKYVDRKNMCINIYDGATSNFVYYDIQNGVVLNADGNAVRDIVDVGSGWYRIIYTRAIIGSGANFRIAMANNAPNISYTGENKEALIYGLQVEAGSYPTSYIPNHSGGSVTRGADSCTGAGDSSTFNSTEGVLYAEISALEDLGTARRYISLSDGSSNNDLRLYFNNSVGTIVALSKVGGVTQFSMFGGGYDLTEAHKIAVKYKVNDFALWIDGVEVDTDSSGLVNAPNTFNELAFNGNSLPFFGKAKQVLVFKEALSDTELIKLTTI